MSQPIEVTLVLSEWLLRFTRPLLAKWKLGLLCTAEPTYWWCLNIILSARCLLLNEYRHLLRFKFWVIKSMILALYHLLLAVRCIYHIFPLFLAAQITLKQKIDKRKQRRRKEKRLSSRLKRHLENDGWRESKRKKDSKLHMSHYNCGFQWSVCCVVHCTVLFPMNPD